MAPRRWAGRAAPPGPLGRSDAAGRVIPHEFVVLGDFADEIRSVEDGLQRVWPLVAGTYARVWDAEGPPSVADLEVTTPGIPIIDAPGLPMAAMAAMPSGSTHTDREAAVPGALYWTGKEPAAFRRNPNGYMSPSIPVMQQSEQGVPTAASRPPKWLWALPVLSCGLLSVVPPIVIAAKLKHSQAWWLAGGLTVAWFLGFALVGSQPENSDNIWTTSGVLLYLVAWIGGVVYGLVMGPKLDWSPKTSSVVPPSYDPNSAAIAEIQLGRRKREEARELARRDPQLARDLRVGRPDLARQYDDGGLVDVNSAPEVTLTSWLGLSAVQSAQVVEVRRQLTRFEHAEDLVNLAGLEPSTYDQVKDRIILL
jgi:DNA uptake protein ComE-like DNA-binding protein